MIGNDVIDLRLARAERKSENFRYLEKICCACEIQQIQDSRDPELMLWTFWAMKESAYKAHQRFRSFSRKLNPIAFKCFLDIDTSKVKIEDCIYQIDLAITSEYIHSSTGLSQIVWKVYRNEKKPYTTLLRSFLNGLHGEISHIEIKKGATGIPVYSIDVSLRDKPISISHHGAFTAFVIPLINC